jgi:hypothetical protein
MHSSHLARAAACLLAAWSVAAAPRAATAPPLADVLKDFGLMGADATKLRAGEIVTRELEPAADTELGVALAVLVSKPLATTAGFIRSDAFFKQDREILAHGELDPAAPEAGLVSAAFAAADQAELKKLLNAKAGDTLNLAASEVQALRAGAAKLRSPDPWKDPRAPEIVSAAYRAILAQRVKDYAQSGLDGIEGYDRGRGTMSPARALRAAQQASTVLKQRAPALEAALSAFPGGASTQATQRWLWLKQRAQDRPAFVLSHRLVLNGPGAIFASERQYFVGQSWNCALVLGALIQTDEGTLLLYANRIDVDAVGGAMGGMKRGIGRGMMESSLRSLFTQVKRAAEGS